MASALDVSSLAEDLLCPICLSLFRDPRMLECGHSFCAHCLEPCIPKGRRRGLCPECRHPFAPRSVTINWALCSLAEKARLLKLDEGAQPGGGGPGRAICTEHEEPLKLFCRQDEEPICLICRDLPQHQGHDFLPVKNAVQVYQDKLKASLVPLTENLNSATEDRRRQQENITALESCVQDLLGYISKEFEVLHQILHEKEEGMKKEVERMKKENCEEMEESLKELDEEFASHRETLSRAQAGLDESDHITFLRGIKELMRRVWEDKQSHGSEEEEEDEQEEEASDEECSSDEDDEVDKDEDVANSEEEEEDEEEAAEDEDGRVVPVDPSLEAFKDSLDFETWRVMLRTIQADPIHEEL